MQGERDAAALDHGGRGAGVEVEDHARRPLHRLGARERRVQLDGGEVGEPHERRQVVGQHVVDRLALGGDAWPCATHSGRWAGACFWKNDLPWTPSGQRVTVSGRPARWGSSTGARAT